MAEGEVGIAGHRIPWWGLAIAGGGILALWTMLHKSNGGGATTSVPQPATDVSAIESELSSKFQTALAQMQASNEANLSALQAQEQGDITSTQQQSTAELAALRDELTKSIQSLQSQADASVAGSGNQEAQILALYASLQTVTNNLNAAYSSLNKRLKKK